MKQLVAAQGPELIPCGLCTLVAIEDNGAMNKTIAVAGATGNLGGRIVKALLARKAGVTALVRKDSSNEKIKALQDLGANLAAVDMDNKREISKALVGAACVVSALQGLQDVVVDTQSALLEAAVTAGVPRFIPSDFSVDFTDLAPGENRNFDLRRSFHKTLDGASIAATSIFNGAFAEMLTYNIPLLDFKEKTVGYWEDPNWRMDFTTMDDTAAFTAAAALDPSTPRALHIAGFSVSPTEIAQGAAGVLKTPFQLKRLGSLEELRQYNKRERAAHPEGEDELYPAWQQTQYMQSMFSTPHQSLDNNRYQDLKWTSLEEVLKRKPAAPDQNGKA